jgi:hypothetical protein
VVALNRELERVTAPQRPPDASGATQAPDASKHFEPSRLRWRSWAVYGVLAAIVLTVPR